MGTWQKRTSKRLRNVWKGTKISPGIREKKKKDREQTTDVAFPEAFAQNYYLYLIG